MKMKRMSSWLFILFMIMFWVFRVIVAITSQMGNDFGGFIAFNSSAEIALLFVTIICFIFILKRNILGAFINLCAYLYYFGGYILTTFVPAISSGQTNMSIVQNGAVAVIGVLIALFIVIDIMVDQRVADKHKDKKTDWFFDDDKFDRKLDERADKNHYRHF